MKPVPYYVLALAMAVPAALVGVEIPSWFSLGSQTIALQSDLRVFYTPGYMLRTGQAKDLYNFAAIRRNQDEKVAPDNAAGPFLHPAYEAVLFVPLSFLPYRAAYVVWAGVNFVILGLIYFLLRPCLPDLSAVGPKWMPPALLLGFMPVAFTILAGQDSLFLLLILVSAYRRIGSNELQAGILVGLGMFRFQVLLPIVALFLLWRSLKVVAGWAIGSTAVLSMSVAITGVGAQIEYARLLRQMASVSGFWLLLGRMPNLRGLFAAYDFGIALLASVGVLFRFSCGGSNWRQTKRATKTASGNLRERPGDLVPVLARSKCAGAAGTLGDQRSYRPEKLAACGSGFRRAVGVRGVLVCSGRVLHGSAIYIPLLWHTSDWTVEAMERYKDAAMGRFFMIRDFSMRWLRETLRVPIP